MPGAERRDQPSSLSLSGAGGALEDISLRSLFGLNILLFRSALFAVIAGGDTELPRKHFGKIIAVEKSALMGDVRNGDRIESVAESYFFIFFLLSPLTNYDYII